MAHAFAAPNVFMPRFKQPFTCLNKPTCLESKVNNVSACVTKSHFEEDTEAATKRKYDQACDTFRGNLIQDGRVLQQNFAIRSYELAPNRKASLGSMMKRLQETAIRHFKITGSLSSGFGSTPEMDRRELVWVTSKLQMEIDNYPSWDDVIQIETWTSASDLGMFRNWVFRDYRTGEVLIRASSLYVLMNVKTRRLSKCSPKIRDELERVFIPADPVFDITRTKLQKLDVNAASHIRSNLSPTWTDLDLNQHVSHVKYLDWVFESIPISVLKNHEVSFVFLEFRKECRMGDTLQSLSSAAAPISHSADNADIEYNHLLRCEDGSVILTGKTKWKPRASVVTNSNLKKSIR